MPLSKLVSMKHHVPKCRPDKDMLVRCEQEYLEHVDAEVVKVGRKKRQIDNTYVSNALLQYGDFYNAKRMLYWLDDIIKGVCCLDLGGNTRPLSSGMIYNFISSSSVINTDIIMSFCNVGERQANKIMLSLSIVNRMVTKELKRMGF